MSKIGFIGVGALVLAAVGTTQAMTPEQKCLSKRAVAAGTYQSCVQRRLARSYGDGGLAQAKLSKCREKYIAKWTKLQQLTGSTTCTQARFVDNGATVTDNLTGLIWEKKTTAVGSGINPLDPNDVDNSYSWTNGDADETDEDGTVFTDYLNNSLTGLNGLGFAGANGWRLPTLAELMTLLNQTYPCAASPCIDLSFGATQPSIYWSATTALPNQTLAWTVQFNDGGVFFWHKTDADKYVRAVRGGL